MFARMRYMQKMLSRLLFLFFLSNSVFAQGNWFASIGTGASFLNVDDNMYVSSGPGWPNDRMHNSSVDTTGLLLVNGGYQWARDNKWFPFYSLAANYTYGFST